MNDNLYRNIDGVLQKGGFYSSADEQFRRRYGVYETMLYRNGTLREQDRHWQRLFRGLEQLGFIIPAYYSPAYFAAAVQELLRANGQEALARVRLQVCSADAGRPREPLFCLESFPLDSFVTAYDPAGLSAGVLPGYHKALAPESNLKLSHNDFEVPARKAVQAYGWDEVLLLNDSGHIAESTIANIFVVKEGEILTPPLSEGCLAGTMRSWLIPQLEQAGFRIREQVLGRTMLEEAEEVFLTNSIRPLRRLARIGERDYGAEMTGRIWEHISPLL